MNRADKDMRGIQWKSEGLATELHRIGRNSTEKELKSGDPT